MVYKACGTNFPARQANLERRSVFATPASILATPSTNLERPTKILPTLSKSLAAPASLSRDEQIRKSGSRSILPTPTDNLETLQRSVLIRTLRNVAKSKQNLVTFIKLVFPIQTQLRSNPEAPKRDPKAPDATQSP